MIEGVAETIPRCSKTRQIMRTNIGMRDDVDWIEEELTTQLKKLNDYFQSPEINKRSITVIEIGAGSAQPLAKKMAEMFLKNDKYRCALIRINPVAERHSQYKDE